MRLVDRVAYINHDIDDAVRAGVLREDGAARRADRGARRHRLAADRRARARPRRALRGRRATSSRARRRARRWTRCGRSCSSTSTSGRSPRREHAKIDRVIAHAVRALRRRPRRGCPTAAASPGADLAAAGDRLHRRDDRPLLHPRVRGAVRAARRSRSRLDRVARYTDDSKERVRDAVDMVDLVGDAHRAAARRASTATRACARSTTSARRRSGSTRRRSSSTASAAARAATRSRSSRRPRASTSTARSSTSPTATASQLEVGRGGSARRPSAARERERLLELLERTATFYVRYLWESAEAAPARRVPRRPRARRGARCASSASATRRPPGTRCCSRSRRAGFSNREIYDAGPRAAREGRGRIYDRFRRRIMFPLCDPRGRVLGFGARALGADQKPKYLNSSEGDRLPQGPPPLRRRHRARGGGEGGQRDRRRGLHRRRSRCTRPGCATRSGSWARR